MASIRQNVILLVVRRLDSRNVARTSFPSLLTYYTLYTLPDRHFPRTRPSRLSIPCQFPDVCTFMGGLFKCVVFNVVVVPPVSFIRAHFKFLLLYLFVTFIGITIFIMLQPYFHTYYFHIQLIMIFIQTESSRMLHSRHCHASGSASIPAEPGYVVHATSTALGSLWGRPSLPKLGIRQLLEWSGDKQGHWPATLILCGVLF